MSILVLAEHNNKEVKSSTLNTISAASKINSEIEILVVGFGIDEICNQISNYQHVIKVHSLDDKKFENTIAENIEQVILSIADKYSHILDTAVTLVS